MCDNTVHRPGSLTGVEDAAAAVVDAAAVVAVCAAGHVKEVSSDSCVFL